MNTKYSNKITIIDNIRFSSRKEAARYSQLKILLHNGLIDSLALQPSYLITIKGIKICKVILDFEYFDVRRKAWITEDVKGMDTAISRLKRKMVEAEHGIKVTLL